VSNKFIFHSPILVKTNLANNYHRQVITSNYYSFENVLDYIYSEHYPNMKSQNNYVYRQDFEGNESFQKSRNSFGLIFGSFPSEGGLRQ
jgi:hypothetical protein